MTEARDEIARDSGLRTLVPILLLVPLLTVLTTWIIRRALLPVTNLAGQLDRRGGANLTPLHVANIPNEIEPFVNSIDALMQRLAVVLSQQRRFIADAAHELRSPLTALTVQAENLQGAASEDAAARIVKLKEGLERARKLLEQLLSHARQQACPTATADVSFDSIVRHIIEDMVPMAVDKNIDLGCERLEKLNVVASAETLAVLVRNAIDNAVRYTPAGGAVDVGLFRSDQRIVFLVEDTGPGIPAGQEEQVFQPFYRVMGNQETGSGLGLAIIHSIAEQLGGDVTLTNRTGGSGAVFRFEMMSSTISP